jgi:hypothetical protein
MGLKPLCTDGQKLFTVLVFILLCIIEAFNAAQQLVRPCCSILCEHLSAEEIYTRFWPSPKSFFTEFSWSSLALQTPVMTFGG